jgi:hypothetical protein
VVIEIVEDQDTISTEFLEQIVASMKHQEQVAPSIVDEHNLIPHNIQPKIPN